MFCSNCGKDAAGNFCANCGSPVNTNSEITPTLSALETVITRNGNSVDMETLFQLYGKNRIKFAVRLTNELHVSAREAKDITDRFMETKLATSDTGFATSKPTPMPTKKQIAKDLIRENEASGVACCPKCGCTSLSANKKGFGIGKAVVGAVATGGIGLVAGNIGAQKVRVTCLKCGHQWMAGK